MAGNPIDNLKQIEAGLVAKALKALNATNQKIKAKLLREQLAGPTSDTTLSKRTGNLGRSVDTDPAKVEGTVVSATLHAGMVYARVHFGPRGSEVKIVPINARMLAIPLAAAKTGAGVARAGPTSTIWGPTKCFKSKAGNLIIWGYQTGRAAMGTKTAQKGIARQAAQGTLSQEQLVPLFVLKESVVVKRRIDPKIDLIDWGKPVMTAELKKAGILKVNG